MHTLLGLAIILVICGGGAIGIALAMQVASGGTRQARTGHSTGA